MQFVHILPFSAIKLLCFVTLTFCMLVYKMWHCKKLWKNDSNKSSNLIFKAICTCSTILSNKIGIFSRNIFFPVRKQIVRTRENLWKNVSNKISNSIFKADWTRFTTLSYKTVKFCRNIILHVFTQNVNLQKIVHKWFKQDFKFDI